MPEVRIDDPDLLDELVDALRARTDVLAEPTGPGRLRVHVIGSYSQEGERLAVFLQLRAWESAQRAAGRGVSVEIIDG